MFSIKKQTIKLEKFSRDRQKQLLKQRKTDSESWVTYTPTLADLNRESRNEYNVPTNVENRATEGSQIREESYLAEESNRGAEELKIETKANK